MRPLGLYLHWPFCARLCPYCDFTIARNRQVDAEAWRDVFLDDLRHFASLTEKRPLRSIYFGGGTPSLMPLEVAEAVLAAADDLFGLAPGCETTIEANPDDLARFSGLAALGFRRLSLGVQSFNDRELRFLGRNHSAGEAERALDAALTAFERVSFDLIYALPDQDPGAWERSLSSAIGRGAGHLSLYQLTIEEGTAFGRAAARGTLVPMPDERAAAFYELTQGVTEAGGMPAYEVSNHARPGEEAVHNGLYWQDADWIGIGPGAHGRLGPGDARLATEGAAQPTRYPLIERSQRLTVERLSRYQHNLEVLASGLRPVAGLALDRLGEDAAAVAARASDLQAEGLVAVDGQMLRATGRGRLVLDQLAVFLSDALAPPGDV